MGMNVPKPERLADISSRLRSALAASDTGPLVVAADVMRLANEWDSYKAEAGGASCTAWLRKNVSKGRGLPFFAARDAAVQKLGESVRRQLHHEVAVWVVGSTPEAKWKDIVTALTFARKRNAGSALTKPMAVRVVRGIIGGQAKPRKVACDRCAKLADVLRANGIDVPE